MIGREAGQATPAAVEAPADWPAIAAQVWDMKYRFKRPDGTPLDHTVESTWRRVARALAEAEREPALWEPQFFEALKDFAFLPAGRILAGAGTGRAVTLFNCFVMGTVPDDMGGIFAHLREAALTLQQGGGIGYDFSTLRPRGAPVAGVGADASGPTSFMDVWDAMCRTIMSAGNRRGAMMATLRCDHPDVEAFIDAKRDPGRLRMFNLSVLVTDPFIAAVREDGPWDLVFDGQVWRTVRARELWDRIMRATYDYAEPGVIFIDRINDQNNLGGVEVISATNPCGEQPLPPYGACLLGSVNLAALVVDAYTPDARLDLDRLARLVPVAVRMLDNAIEVSRFPLPAQAQEAQAKRRVGLGVTGLADALILCGVRYGTQKAVDLTRQWLGAVRRHAYRASASLAAEKGAFPLYDRDRYLARPMIRGLDDVTRAAVERHGVRNALLTSIAPTGTISLLAGNVSSGIEPVFTWEYDRAVLQPDGSRKVERVADYAYHRFRLAFGPDAPLPDSFVDAGSLPPGAHLVMQAAAQEEVDSSISKTINCPADLDFEAFKDVYLQAYDLGCKGCTTYRPNAITGSVLSAPAAPAPDTPPPPSPVSPVPSPASGAVPLDRPEALVGATYKVRWPGSDHALYITINDIVIEEGRRPFEVFINSKNMEHYAWTVALTRMISAVFRRGGDVAFVVEELKAVFDPRGGQWMKGRYVPSLLAAIGEVIERHMLETGFLLRPSGLPSVADGPADTPSPPGKGTENRAAPTQCPRCGQATLTHQEGCDTCLSCGYSRCG
ncbi:adenosylcobalamin-dependent ribonucleoside-diphosphate reductase [Azospirillum sp. B4]|uniref:adenosylcobalamin-dependent ribonucleoside-diphosphate reductase n=1 Tax=Azospirillum sp. B4 TaxID=95605 RepID=UPI000344A9DD|nr:adenosylcobalamin-dependent ribonucleoside-diphosphate reductase [Azospirillum sp. B4]